MAPSLLLVDKLTKLQTGPKVPAIMEVLGVDQVFARLRAGLEHVKSLERG